ncbi:hypothetical protein CP532_0032 [Ophiocordyceps camponoti-leonardi (nom. inval.)]|nr:hypothetical protein CP532_0032 [Ophiocordyceps camponoti-leonardi (nom. inval.)]
MNKLQGSAWTRVACRRAISTTPPLSRKSIFRRQRRSKKDSVDDDEPITRPTKPPRSPLPEATLSASKLEDDVSSAYTRIFLEMKMMPVVSHEFRRREFDRRMHRVNAAIEDCFLLVKNRLILRQYNPLYHRLSEAKAVNMLDNEIRHMMTAALFRDRITPDMETSMKRLTDFTTPYDWFPATRALQRTVHIHVGPTNSGKTYNALKALEKSKSGIYAGPLRLLAVEVYDRMRAKGYPCALITGEEVRLPEDTDCYLISATVEMIPLNRRFDVAVIDEVQMVSNIERGSGWTSAILGVQAKEIHVCGEERSVDLIKKMCATTGDKCVIHRYQRLNALHTSEVALGQRMSQLQKGDAVIAFSRRKLLLLRTRIEKATGRRCAIVYGALPPEVRKAQAELFNRPDNEYDFVVASDAIGMGINLGIRRVVFMTKSKFDGGELRDLHPYEVKQIAGRAGRYRTAANPTAGEAEENGGWVTTMLPEDLPFIKEALDTEMPPITQAAIDAPVGVVERFATFYPPGTQLAFILMQIKAMATMSPLYHLNVGKSVLTIANALHDIPLSISDKMTFCYMPAALQVQGALDVMRALAKIVASGQVVDLLDMPEMPLQYLNDDAADYYGTEEYLGRLESLSVALNQYIWLSYRYTSLFQSQRTALHVRDLLAKKLIETLTKATSDKEEADRKLKEKQKSGQMQRRIASLQSYTRRKRFFNDGGDEELGMPKTADEAKTQLDELIELTDKVAATAADPAGGISVERWTKPIKQADVEAELDAEVEMHLEALADEAEHSTGNEISVEQWVDVFRLGSKRPRMAPRLGMATGAAASAWAEGGARGGAREKKSVSRDGSDEKGTRKRWSDVRPEEEVMAEMAFAGMLAASKGSSGRGKTKGVSGKSGDSVSDTATFETASKGDKGNEKVDNDDLTAVYRGDKGLEYAFRNTKGFKDTGAFKGVGKGKSEKAW